MVFLLKTINNIEYVCFYYKLSNYFITFDSEKIDINNYTGYIGEELDRDCFAFKKKQRNMFWNFFNEIKFYSYCENGHFYIVLFTKEEVENKYHFIFTDNQILIYDLELNDYFCIYIDIKNIIQKVTAIKIKYFRELDYENIFFHNLTFIDLYISQDKYVNIPFDPFSYNDTLKYIESNTIQTNTTYCINEKIKNSWHYNCVKSINYNFNNNKYQDNTLYLLQVSGNTIYVNNEIVGRTINNYHNIKPPLS